MCAHTHARACRGILVHRNDANRSSVVFELNPTQFFVPASNKKLLTSAAALISHGPEFTFKTPLLVVDESNDESQPHQLAGEGAERGGGRPAPQLVVLCGAGDPSLRQAALERAATVLVPKLDPSRQVTVVAVAPPGDQQDDSPGSSSVGSWEWSDLATTYGAQPSPFMVDVAAAPPAADAAQQGGGGGGGGGGADRVTALPPPSPLGERSANALLIEVAPGAAAGDPAVVQFSTDAERRFGSHLTEIVSTVVTTSGAAAAARGTAAGANLAYWYTLDNSNVLRIDGQVPAAPSSNAEAGAGAAPSPAATLLKVAALDPATRAEALLASALVAGFAALRPTAAASTTAAPAGPSGRASLITQAIRDQCVAARRGSESGSESGSAVITSDETLLSLLNHTLQESDNTYAEALCRMQGLAAAGGAGGGGGSWSYSAGLDAVAAQLDILGINRSDYVQADGSGLSRHNLVTPAALVRLLEQLGGGQNGGGGGGGGGGGERAGRGAGRPDGRTPSSFASPRSATQPHPLAAEWRALLPVAGRTGTLASRFQGTPLVGELVAKTGTLGGVSALSGYVHKCTFSMLVNNAPVPSSVLREALDSIALAFGLDTMCL